MFYQCRAFTFVIAVVFFMGGCAHYSGPVPVRDTSSVEIMPRSVPASRPNSIVSDITSDEPVTGAKGVSSDAEGSLVQAEGSAKSPLMMRWLSEASLAIANQDYAQAIALAERGLRLDRREPRFYRLLAQSYRHLGNIKQSIFFALQGLRYAHKNTAVFSQLRALANP